MESNQLSIIESSPRKRLSSKCKPTAMLAYTQQDNKGLSIQEFALTPKQLNSQRKEFEKWCKKDTMSKNFPKRLDELNFFLMQQPLKILPTLDQIKASHILDSPRAELTKPASSNSLEMTNWVDLDKIGSIKKPFLWEWICRKTKIKIDAEFIERCDRLDRFVTRKILEKVCILGPLQRAPMQMKDDIVTSRIFDHRLAEVSGGKCLDELIDYMQENFTIDWQKAPLGAYTFGEVDTTGRVLTIKNTITQTEASLL